MTDVRERTLDLVASVPYYNGELLAVLRITEEFARALLALAEAFRAAKGFSPRLHQMTEYNYDVDWIEDEGSENDTAFGDVPVEDIDPLFEWAESEDLETSRNWKSPPAGLELPALANCRTENDLLIVEGSAAESRPGKVDFYWTARLKHTDNEDLETPFLAEEAIRAWLDSN